MGEDVLRFTDGSSMFQRRQLIELGALSMFLQLVAKDEHLIRSIYQDCAKLYHILALLLRSCDTSTCSIPPIEASDDRVYFSVVFLDTRQ
jgi:hypothetical protein